MPKSSIGRRNGEISKPAKPRPDFPLFAHATKRWAKKIRGKLHYFGSWDDPDGALKRYLDQREDLKAGRRPRQESHTAGLTVRDLVNHFLDSKKMLVDSREIQQRTWGDYHRTASHVVKVFGRGRLVDDLRPDDFERLRAYFAKGRKAEAVGNEVQRARCLFKYAYDAVLVDRPLRYGPTFKRPSRRILRRDKQAKGPRMFTAEQIRVLLAEAGPQIRGMVLLGINAALGPTDLGELRRRHVDLASGVLDFPRPKTSVERRAILWTETMAALRIAERVRPAAKIPDYDDRIFLTQCGAPWVRITEAGNAVDSMAHELGKLMRRLDMKRVGLAFYALRHTFETIASETLDQAAVDRVMGHERNDMPTRYRQKIDDDRLRRVADHVRDWLFSDTGKE